MLQQRTQRYAADLRENMAIPRLSRVFGGIPVYENNHARGNEGRIQMDVGRRSATSFRQLSRHEISENRRAINRAISRLCFPSLAIPRVRTPFQRLIGAPQKRYEKSPINPAAYGTRLTALAFRLALRANRESQRPRIRTQERKKGQVDARAGKMMISLPVKWKEE